MAEKSISAYELKERVASYDEKMDLMHPNRPKMADVALEFLPFDQNKEIKAIDLGVGTGFFTAKFLEKFPNSTIIAIDGAQAMIDLAKVRLDQKTKNIDFRVSDFRKVDEILSDVSQVDVIFSSFSLHHLNVKEKTEVLKYLLTRLKPGGWLLNADCIIMPTQMLENRVQELRINGIIKRNEEKDPNITDFTTVRKWLDKLEADEGDQPMTTDQELKIMQDAGFENVSIIWQEFREAVFCGNKK